MSALDLLRTADDGGVHVYTSVETLRDARQKIAWTCTDNLGKTRAEASAIADRFHGGRPFIVDRYSFEWLRDFDVVNARTIAGHTYAVGDQVRVGGGQIAWTITGFFGAGYGFTALQRADLTSSNTSAHLSRLVPVSA